MGPLCESMSGVLSTPAHNIRDGKKFGTRMGVVAIFITPSDGNRCNLLKYDDIRLSNIGDSNVFSHYVITDDLVILLQ